MPLPMLHFSAAGLSADEAFQRWRALIAPIYRIDHARGAGKPPMGEAIAYLCGDILFNRTIFEAQQVSRDKKLVDATPDHVILQFWRSGGYNGEIAERPIAYGGGCVRFVDCRRVLGGRFTRSDTVGFTIPRRLVEGIQPERVPTILDPRRNRLAAAKITSLYSRVSLMEAPQVPDVTADVLAFLRRLLDPSPAVDVLLGSEFDESLLQLAKRVIASHIDDRELTPDFVAEQIGVSRATLYRVFAQVGGVMRHVAEQRLLAASRMLADPLERRSLVTLSENLGFSSPALFSRAFRARFGLPPREWRQQQVDRIRKPTTPITPLNRWWSRLGEPGLARPASFAPSHP